MTARAALALLLVAAAVLGFVTPAPAAEPPPEPDPSPSTRPDPRIVGGSTAEPGKWLSMAALVLRGRPAYDTLQCGGTVIDRSWVLTAAHCVTDFDTGRAWAASNYDIVLNNYDLRWEGNRIPVVEVRRHPGFDPETLVGDVALLRLDRPVPGGIPIQPLAASGSDPAGGTDVVAVGWGETSPYAYPTLLQEATLDFRSSGACRNDNGPAFQAASMVCAWRYGKSTCYGDSGGPLLEQRGDTWVQVGITSWGYECGVYTSVFARVSAFSSWIRWQVRYGAQPDAASFVRRQYLDLFGRQPSNTELYYAVAGLQDGQSTVAYVAGLLGGKTYTARSGGVVRLYLSIFQRPPDSSGLTFWMKEINRGVSLKRIADKMVRAPEFVDEYGTLGNGAFVDLVYENVLGRTPSPTDRAYWVDQLDTGRRTRGKVMVGFSESQEYRNATATVTKVTGPFWGLVRRAPNAGEMAQWEARTTTEIARHLLASWSYANRF